MDRTHCDCCEKVIESEMGWHASIKAKMPLCGLLAAARDFDFCAECFDNAASGQEVHPDGHEYELLCVLQRLDLLVKAAEVEEEDREVAEPE